MASLIANVVGKRILKESARNSFGAEDPYFEQVPATRLNGKGGNKTKKVKKRLPPGISSHDAKVLNKVKRRAYRLDLSLFNCCGIRFGWGAIIGLIPFAGDCVDLLLARMVIETAKQVEGGLPSQVVSRMYMNAIIDFVIGFVPFIGDIADAVYKCNTRNAVLLEKELRKRGQARLKGQQTSAIDPSLPEVYDREEEEANHRNGGPPPNYDSAPTQPSRSQPRDGSGRGWFGGRSGGPDVEMGEGPSPQPPRQKSQKLQRERR